MPEFGEVSLEALVAKCGKGATLEQFQAAMNYSILCQRYVHWWIGDLLIEMKERYGDGAFQAIDPTASLDLLTRCEGLSREMPPHQRRPDLSWTHHAQASRIGEETSREDALQRAAEMGWNSQEMAKYVSAVLGNIRPPNPY